MWIAFSMAKQLPVGADFSLLDGLGLGLRLGLVEQHRHVVSFHPSSLSHRVDCALLQVFLACAASCVLLCRCASSSVCNTENKVFTSGTETSSACAEGASQC